MIRTGPAIVVAVMAALSLASFWMIIYTGIQLNHHAMFVGGEKRYQPDRLRTHTKWRDITILSVLLLVLAVLLLIQYQPSPLFPPHEFLDIMCIALFSAACRFNGVERSRAGKPGWHHFFGFTSFSFYVAAGILGLTMLFLEWWH